MKAQGYLIAAVAVLLTASSQAGYLSAQAQGQGMLLFERYSFDDGLGYSAVSEISVPVSVSYALTPQASLTFSAGFTRIALTPSDGSDDIAVNGLTDSEARLTYQVLPDRLSVLLTGRIPTGIDELQAEEGTILQVLATDVLGFATRSLGSGGSIGGGLASAFPVGRMALGLAGTVTQAGSFVPVAGLNQELKPGTELRLRAGLEGPLGELSYLRVAAIFASRGDDEVNGDPLGSGSRFSGYVSLDQRVGNTSVLLYAFDQFRADPQVEAAAFGGVLPKGNLVALGAQVTVPVSRVVRVTPRLEFRRADQAPDLDQDELEKLGTSLRFSADVRYRVGPQTELVIEAGGLTGNVVSGSNDIGTSGFRLGAGLRLGR